MKSRRAFLSLLAASALGGCALAAAGCQANRVGDDQVPQAGDETVAGAVYAGVKGYGTVTADDKDSFVHLFTVDGEEREYAVSVAGNYALQNRLQGGYAYDLIVEGGTVTDAVLLQDADQADAYVPPVQSEAGLTTLKNYLACAFAPMGTTLYVYGGAWDWQDSASSNQAMTIGVPQSWVDFFNAQDAGYTYKGEDPATSYYPFGDWNQYYWAGADCSGYIGWVLYNTLETESSTVSESEGYVMPARKVGSTLAAKGWGTLSSDVDAADFRPGDIFSMKGHVWTVVGTCEDGSIVIAHSTATDSKTGNPGSGVQLSALNPAGDTDTDCAAYELACRYMQTYFPAWSARYDVVVKPYTEYVTCSEDEGTGRFSWDLEGGVLSDPDGFAEMGAAEVLAALFEG